MSPRPASIVYLADGTEIYSTLDYGTLRMRINACEARLVSFEVLQPVSEGWIVAVRPDDVVRIEENH